MAGEAVVDVGLQNLIHLLIQDSIAFDNVIDQVEDIRLKLRRMRGYLIDAELREDDEAKEWVTNNLRIFFLVENQIESFVLSLAARGRRNIGFFQRRGFTLFAAIDGRFGAGKVLRRKLHVLADDIAKLEDERPRKVVDASLRAGGPSSDEQEETPPGKGKSTTLASSSSASNEQEETTPGKGKSTLASSSASNEQEETTPEKGKSTKSFPSNPRSNWSPCTSQSPSTSRNPLHSTHPKPTPTHPDQEGSDLIGFEEDLTQLVKRLKGDQGQGGWVIPVCGPAGSGKTTLVQKIYNLREIKTHFYCRVWAHAPDERITISQTLARISESLMDQRNLVVLDHINEVEHWNKFKSAFPHLHTGDSKVILITRNDDLAELIYQQENSQRHFLDVLCPEQSWELFAKKSCLYQEKVQLDDAFRDQILKKCGGRPFEIVLLGGLLSTKERSCDEWKWYLSQARCRKMDILQLCYTDLPVYSKLCLLYMALFPNEVDISVRRLHRLWLAEGFVRQSPGMSEEDIVERCFDDLVNRNFVKISKFSSDGSPKTCRLPRALREYLTPIALNISLFYIHQVSAPDERFVRRVIEYVDIESYNADYENLRSYLSFKSQSKDIPAKEVGNFICKIIGNKGFGALKVLDLEGVYKPTLPETLKHLFHLRYLGLRWTFIDHLPKSVGDLPYLETLDLKQTNINNLPSSIWKLKHLRHLNLPDIHLDYRQKKSNSSLTKLRTLVGLVIDGATPVKEDLSQLCELRELGITCQLSCFKPLLSWIQKSTNLRLLSLKSKNKMGRPFNINLDDLSKLCQLSHMSLLGNLERLPTENAFPPNLIVLALSVSQLKDDPMTTLSKLPSLTVLRLLAESYLGKKMHCPGKGFDNLKVLKLWMLKELEEWTVENGGMPCLKELNIRCCQNLKEIPNQLLHRDTLEELTLTTMPEEFVKRVQNEKQSRTVLTRNYYDFTPLPWEKDPDLWNEP